MVLVSLSVFRKDNTAETPSALRNAVAGLMPRAVLSEKPPPCEVLPGMVLVKLETLLERVPKPDELPVMGEPPGEVVDPADTPLPGHFGFAHRLPAGDRAGDDLGHEAVENVLRPAGGAFGVCFFSTDLH